MPDQLVNLNQAPYYDDYDPTKGYTQVVAVPGRVEQAREFTQIQDMFLDFLKRLGNVMTRNGSVIEGCNITIVNTSVTITAGKIYYNGIIYPVPQANMTITGQGKEVIGVCINQSLITESQDSTLRDPAQGFDNYSQPGAYRVQSALQYTLNDASSAPVFNLLNGVLQVNESAPQLSVFNDLMARRMYDEAGNYKVSGLDISTQQVGNTLYLGVASGRAYVMGYEVDIPAASKTSMNLSTSIRSVISEPKVFTGLLYDPNGALNLGTDSATSSSFIASTTYYVAYDFYNSYGRTKLSPVASKTITTSGNDITTTITLPSGAGGVGIYVGGTSSPLMLGGINSAGQITYSGSATSGLSVTVSGSTLTITISKVATSTGALAQTNNTTPQLNYPLNNNPVKDISQLTATVQVSQSITRGSVVGGSDALPLTPVAQIISVTQGATTYVQGTDYQLTNNSVDWSLPGAEPSVGSTYTVVWQYVDTMVQGTDYTLTSTGSDTTAAYSVTLTGNTLPVNGTTMYVNYDYYLARKDLVQLDQNGNVVITQGQPDVMANVQAPTTSNNSLLQLGTVTLYPNSYTTIVNSYAITRMSMADLQALYNQVQTLQYNQAVTSLENQAMSGQNPATLKGIFTDGFVDLSRGDLSHPSFNMAFDFATSSIILPYSNQTPAKPIVDLPNSSVTTYGRVATAPVTEVVGIQQPFATDQILINPYNTYNQQATVTLSPEVDNWIDTSNITVNNTRTAAFMVHRWWYHGGTYYNDTEAYLAKNLQLTNGSQFGGWNQITGTITTNNSQNLLDQAEYYMRSLTVTITASNFIPYSDNVACTFAGQSVSLAPTGTTTAGTNSGTVKADGNGKVTATFTVPSNIPCGTVPVILSNMNNSATTYYTAQGRKRVVEDIVTKTLITVKPYDPVAESFMFLDGDHIVTSVGLYFAVKDSTQNVTVQIRDMVNGFPGSTIYTQQVITPSNINTDPKGATETRVSFSNPVLCKQNTQYCVVVQTNSYNYQLYVGTLGKKDLNTGAVVATNPYLNGTLFTSANALTWSPSQSQDLKFNVYVGQYPTSGTIQFQPITGLTADAIVLMADYLTPGNTGCSWNVKLNNATWVPLANYVGTDLSATANSVTLQAVFQSSQYLSPMLALDSFTLVSFLTATSGTYVGKNTNFPQGFTNVTVVFNANIPSGCTITPRFATDTSGTSWQNLTLSSTSAVSNTVTQYTYTATIATATNFRVRLDISAPNSLARPSASSLMCTLK